MPMKEQSRQAYRTAINGKEVDMHKLVMQNEMTVAVGNVRVNARGDELGPGGQIIRKREDVLDTVIALRHLPDYRADQGALARCGDCPRKHFMDGRSRRRGKVTSQCFSGVSIS